MLVIRKEESERLGLHQVLDECRCFSPQGRRLKRKRRYFTPGEQEDLNREFDAIDRLMPHVRQHKAEVLDVQSLLGHLRDLGGTISGLEKGRTLDLTEFYEIKEAARLIRALSQYTSLLTRAGISLNPLPDLETLLDPAGQGTSGFYLYDEYSEHLARLRKDRAALERLAEEETAGKRAQLLARRAQLVAEEEDEESSVRTSLTLKLRPFAAALQESLDGAGLLDFRLAKAELAIQWGASRPDLQEEGQALILEAVYHPLIEAHLLSRGASYERQTLTLHSGAAVLTGPNMGGKSVGLKAVTLSAVLIHLGYFPPAAYAASPLFDFISYHSDHFDTTKKGLSSFAAEMVSLRDDVERSKDSRGLIVTDEPCRGTNPQEASALIGALIRYYAGKAGIFLVATHYPVPEGQGISHWRIRGIMEEALADIMENGAGQLSDQETIRRIESLMDYTIESADRPEPGEGAVRIARWLGLGEEVLELL